jgi:hypothetical protein
MTIDNDIRTVGLFHRHNIFAVDQAYFAWHMFSVHFSSIDPN